MAQTEKGGFFEGKKKEKARQRAGAMWLVFASVVSDSQS